MSVALVRLLCGFVVLLLALSLPLAEFQSTCPPASSGIQFDFSSLGNQQAGIVDKQGNGRGLWVSLNCEGTGHCNYGGREWVACASWSNGAESMWAGLGDVPGSWRYLNSSQPAQGAEWTMEAGVDLYDGCTANKTRTTITYQCVNYPGDDHMEVMESGVAPDCGWQFRVNSAAVCALAPPASGKVIVPGANWTATDNSSIQAHAPGMLVDPRDGSFWWYGESEKVSDARQHGVNCYHSSDFITWTNYGMVVHQADITVPGEKGPFIIERPKVLYNAANGTYVMWFHLDSQGYSLRRVGISVAFKPQGPFRLVHSFQPDDMPSLDMSVYEDKVNGTVRGAYFVRSVDNSYVGISALSPDYMTTTGLVSVIPEAREGHAIFHYGDHYFMLTSHLTGWNPNGMEAFITNKDSLVGAIWSSLGNPTGSDISFNSQPALVVPYTSQTSGLSYFIYLGDRWMPNLLNASYIWLPIFINQDNSLTISWRDRWDLDHPFTDRVAVELRRRHGRVWGE